MEIRRFVEFEDKEGNIQLLPYIKGTIDETELRCQDVECYCSDLYCIECPLSLQNEKRLFEDKFKILELEDNE